MVEGIGRTVGMKNTPSRPFGLISVLTDFLDFPRTFVIHQNMYNDAHISILVFCPFADLRRLPDPPQNPFFLEPQSGVCATFPP